MGVVAEENGLLGAVAGVGGAIGRAVGDMFAAEKRLNATMASAPGAGQKFNVTKDTVLQAGKIITTQREALLDSYATAYRELRVELDDGDKVNQDIADAWNSRLVDGDESYAGRVQQYIESLDNLATQLRDVATQYGFTEDDVKASFGAAK
ncbi:hypothetical protein ACQPZF_40905 [Actinosynnema sp. CS-041913]|uniref:hypothetical protein n=1 Tax=Actinosynnema sp. CS-041913 TaxID=3239917 RepID=UPI003D8D6F3A